MRPKSSRARRKRLARQIRAERTARGLTQAELGQILGVEMQTVYKWEAARKDGSQTLLRAAFGQDPMASAFASRVIQVVLFGRSEGR
jgi:DNA-binding XRE family transcriptional regulator